MKTKISRPRRISLGLIIILIVLIGLSAGGFFVYCKIQSWPPACNFISDPKGKKLCEICKRITGARVQKEVEKGKVKEEDITQITFFEGEGMTADPSWNPDGSQIVFGREGALYIINSDGTGLTKIGGVNSYDPSWSPVDNRILCSEGGGISMIDLDKDKTKTIPLGTKHAWLPAWSPDGKKITYTVYDESNAPVSLWDFKCDGTGILSSIWIMNSDGTGKTQLTTDEDGYCSDSSFSPDGSEIVYKRGFVHPQEPSLIKSPANEIWIMNSDGSNKQAIYTPEEDTLFLQQHAWSKNNEIIFLRNLYQRTPQIWLINSDGTNPRCILNPEEKGMPTVFYHDLDWDNTGTKIVTIKEGSLPQKPGVYLNSNVVIFSLEE